MDKQNPNGYKIIAAKRTMLIVNGGWSMPLDAVRNLERNLVEFTHSQYEDATYQVIVETESGIEHLVVEFDYFRDKAWFVNDMQFYDVSLDWNWRNWEVG